MRQEILNSYNNEDFLRTIYELLLKDPDDRSLVSIELIRLHNEGLIDIVSSFEKLKNNSDSGYDFFLTRYIFQDSLPDIKAATLPVMNCVFHLFTEAGDDGAAGMILENFVQFCEKSENRCEDALKEIKLNPGKMVQLLVPVILAGTRLNFQKYLSETLNLTKHEDIEIRKASLFALGRIQYPDNYNLDGVFSCLEQATEDEGDDIILANISKSAFGIYQNHINQAVRATDLIKVVFLKGGETTLHAGSEFFGFHFKDISKDLLDNLLGHLLKVNVNNRGTLNMIDYGVDKMLDVYPDDAIEFLEKLLIKNSENISLEIFDSVIFKVFQNKILFNRLWTRWFLKGDRVLCRGILSIVRYRHDIEVRLEVDTSEFSSTNAAHNIFLARKAIGYLFFEPISAVSAVVSLMRNTTDKNVIAQLSQLLLNPMLINYPGKVRDYLLAEAKGGASSTNRAIKKALKDLDKYLNDLKLTGVISELCPSQTQRESYRRHFSNLLSESQKESEKKSVFLNLVSKSILLYGRKSINYIYGPDGQSNRMVAPLQSFSTEIEIPRMERIDPFNLDYMLRIFSVERFIK
jgi:hypothetical protein